MKGLPSILAFPLRIAAKAKYWTTYLHCLGNPSPERVGRIIGIVQSKYLNNILEQDHRFIKRVTKPMLGFKAFHSAVATLAGIEAAHMIRKGQLGQKGTSAFKQFVTLAG